MGAFVPFFVTPVLPFGVAGVVLAAGHEAGRAVALFGVAGAAALIAVVFAAAAVLQGRAELRWFRRGLVSPVSSVSGEEPVLPRIGVSKEIDHDRFL